MKTLAIGNEDGQKVELSPWRLIKARSSSLDIGEKKLRVVIQRRSIRLRAPIKMTRSIVVSLCF